MQKHRPRPLRARRLLSAGVGLAALALTGCGGEPHVYGVVVMPQPDLAEHHVYGVVPNPGPGDMAEHHVYGVVVMPPDAGGDGSG